MHDLPAVFHVWSTDYTLPGLRKVFDVETINEFYVQAFMIAVHSNADIPAFLSLGCGDGAIEIAIARTLLERGMGRFRFVCYDLSDILLDRFRKALPAELAPFFELVAGDLNAHVFQSKFDAAMANHSLHHIADLEGVYQTTFDCLSENGIFVINDMIGRNGHRRWPETRLFVDFFWPFLTARQRRNVQMKRHEGTLIDHDCSTQGFEGIRAQEVLPLILKQGFHPWKFLGFGGVIDVFVDRSFGPNFNLTDADDVFLARRIGFLNEVLLDAGLVKPTMMLAYFTKTPRDESVHFRNRSAEASVRDAAEEPAWLDDALADFKPSATDPDYVFGSGSPIATPTPPPPATPTPAPVPEHPPAGLVAALRYAQDQHAAAQATIARQAEQIRTMQRSISWELTAPLRTLSRLFGPP